MMFDRRLLREIDWILLALLMCLSIIGVAAIHSLSHLLPHSHALKQIVFLAVGLGTLFLIMAVNYQFLVTLSPYLYVFVVTVLAGSLVFARLVAGTKSWIRVGLVGFQPSEFAKIILILIFARLFSEYKRPTMSAPFSSLALGVAAVPLVLVMIQPDLGTALTMTAVVAAAFILAGMRRKSMIVFLILALALGLGGWNFGLKDYQKRRLTTLLDPQQDPRGSGYQIIQSKIAIGSGGLSGKGFMHGTQSQLRFLPARHTDFIFSVIGEEFGFVGVFVVMGLYFLLLARMFLSVNVARDRAGVYLIFMASMLVAFQFFINVLMVIGLFPVTGIPLPFVSYGGSSLITNFLACGLVMNVRMRRFANV